MDLSKLYAPQVCVYVGKLYSSVHYLCTYKYSSSVQDVKRKTVYLYLNE